MGFKPRLPRKITALLKVGVGAEDSEYTRALEHWHYLLGKRHLRMIFEADGDSRTDHSKGSFKTEVLDGQSMKKGGSYLIVESISGTFVGVINGVRARTIGGRLPVPGRLHYLIPMGQA